MNSREQIGTQPYLFFSRERTFVLISGLFVLFLVASLFVYYPERNHFMFSHWLRFLFVLPIAVAGYFFEGGGALMMTMGINVVYFPLLFKQALHVSFSKDFIELFFSLLLVNGVGIAIGYFAGKERKARLRAELLVGVSAKLYRAFSTKEIWRSLLREVVSLLEVEEGILLIKERNRLVPMEALSSSAERRKNLLARDYNFPESLSQAVLKEGEPFISNALASDERIRFMPIFSCHHLLVLPLEVSGETCGVMQLVNKKDGVGFTKSDVALALLVVGAAQNAIRNMHLVGELRETQQALVQHESLAAMGRLAAGVAHEINTPLGTVIGYAQMLLRKLSIEPKSRQYLLVIEEEARRCARIVKGLLHFARRAPLMKQLCHLQLLVEDTMLVVDKALLQGIKVKRSYPEHLVTLSLDPDQAKQVLLNVILNALKSMPQGGYLVLKIVEHGKGAVVEIEDTGCGISEENLPHIFEPFFSTRVSEEGTGLGLAISYRIMQAHGGWIRMKSEVGKGSCCSLFFPYQVEAVQ